MLTIDQLLDRAKKAQGIESDYRLAQLLEVSKNAITNYRHGKSRPDDEVAMRLAALINRDPASVIAELHAERAKSPEVRALWLRMANQLRHAVAAVMLTMGAAMLLLAGSPTPAEASTGGSVQSQSGSLCIMLNALCNDVCGKSVLKDLV
jgi:transcriptional regulator with XRE-family HTH domain